MVSNFDTIKNIFLYVLLEGKPFSAIYSEYIQKIDKKIPTRQAFTGSVLKMGNGFIKFLKGTIQQMNSTYIAIDEWIDKVKRCFIRATIQGVYQNQFKNMLIFSKEFQQLGKYLREKMAQIINDFKITDNFESFVSDGESNMLSAFDNHFQTFTITIYLF